MYHIFMQNNHPVCLEFVLDIYLVDREPEINEYRYRNIRKEI